MGVGVGVGVDVGADVAADVGVGVGLDVGADVGTEVGVGVAVGTRTVGSTDGLVAFEDEEELVEDLGAVAEKALPVAERPAVPLTDDAPDAALHVVTGSHVY